MKCGVESERFRKYIYKSATLTRGGIRSHDPQPPDDATRAHLPFLQVQLLRTT
jgi:hypothetical protein